MKKLLILTMLVLLIGFTSCSVNKEPESLKQRDVRLLLRTSKKTLRKCKDKHFFLQVDFYREQMKNNPRGLTKLNMVINSVCKERELCN